MILSDSQKSDCFDVGVLKLLTVKLERAAQRHAPILRHFNNVSSGYCSLFSPHPLTWGHAGLCGNRACDISKHISNFSASSAEHNYKLAILCQLSFGVVDEFAHDVVPW